MVKNTPEGMLYGLLSRLSVMMYELNELMGAMTGVRELLKVVVL